MATTVILTIDADITTRQQAAHFCQSSPDRIVCVAMRLRSVWSRRAVLAMATLQLGLPGAASIADGFFAAESAAAPATHVEEHSSSHCRRVHTEDCVLCRIIGGTATTPNRAPIPPAIRRSFAAWPALPLHERHPAARRLPQGRAPPVMVHGLA